MSKKIIYWSIWTFPNRLPLINMVCEKPELVLNTLPSEHESKENSYRRCYGSKNKFLNTYVLKSPITASAKIVGHSFPPYVEDDVQNKSNMFILQKPAFKNIHSIEYDFKWIFFSEESIKMHVYQPYMHQTEAFKYGYVASGSYDIGKWFRPVNATYNLWEGNDYISVKQNDPLIYLDFDIDEKVELREFSINQEILDISQACLGYKNYRPNQPFSKIYEVFEKSGNRKRLINEIKKSII